MIRTLATVCDCAQQAIIHDVRGPRPIRRRLLEMGLVPGTHITFVRYAPWTQDTIVFSLRNYRLALRADLAQWVDIRILV